MTALLEAANYHQTRRHYAKELTSKAAGRGREGLALCTSEAAPTIVYDQDAHDYWARVSRYHASKQITELPLCKRCVKSAAAQGLEVPA